MRNDGGFEGNCQTLRILSKLEKFSKKSGPMSLGVRFSEY
jgi:dGTP triphosphohydrolase